MIFANKQLVLLWIASLSSTATVIAESNRDSTDDTHSRAPIWPDQWHAEFSIEHWGNTWLHQTSNGGSYHYDWKRGVSIEEHLHGQQDNWCTCADKGSGACRIYHFTKDPLKEGKGAATYAWLPKLELELGKDKIGGVCCKLFQGIGAGPLFPTWMSGTKFDGYGIAGEPKRKCQQWFHDKPGNGALMTGDLWMTDDDGIPCAYVDKFKLFAKIFGLSHSFHFNATTYSTEEESNEVFELPAWLNCNQECPNRNSPRANWCKATYPAVLPGQGPHELVSGDSLPQNLPVMDRSDIITEL